MRSCGSTAATIYISTPDGYASPRTVRGESEAARRAYDNPWVIDGHFVEVADVDAHCEQARAADNWTQDGKLETVSVEAWTVLLDGR